MIRYTLALFLQTKGASRLDGSGSDVRLLVWLLVAVIITMSVIEPNFYSKQNIINILRNSAFLSIVACGQAFVLIIRGFDLSVGAVVALSSIIAAQTMSWVVPLFPDSTWLIISIGICAGLGCGLAVGLFNGFCVSFLNVPGFVVTLGSMSATLGLALMLTSGIPVYGMPEAFVRDLGRAQWFSMPISVYVALAIIAVCVVVQRRTLFGRYTYAIGGNLQAAILSGVRARKYIIVSYAVSGALAALTGILLTAQVGSGQASFGGDRMTMQSIAAAVIGGVSLRGGIGRIEMVALSTLFLVILINSLNLLKIDSRLQLVFLGLIMVAAVALEEAGRRRVSRD